MAETQVLDILRVHRDAGNAVLLEVHDLTLAAAYADLLQAQGEEALAEDRRLMYVAVTRARRRLLLTSAAGSPGVRRA
mgnify:CR=1 FL=1